MQNAPARSGAAGSNRGQLLLPATLTQVRFAARHAAVPNANSPRLRLRIVPHAVFMRDEIAMCRDHLNRPACHDDNVVVVGSAHRAWWALASAARRAGRACPALSNSVEKARSPGTKPGLYSFAINRDSVPHAGRSSGWKPEVQTHADQVLGQFVRMSEGSRRKTTRCKIVCEIDRTEVGMKIFTLHAEVAVDAVLDAGSDIPTGFRAGSLR